MSQKMKAALTILAEDGGLAAMAWPLVSLSEGAVDWEKIFQLPLSHEQRAMCEWARCLWLDEVPLGTNPFGSILGLDANVRRAILKAASIRWRL